MGWIGLDSKKRQMDWNGLDLRSLLLWFGLVVGWISNHWQAYLQMDFHVMYDLKNSVLSVQPADCGKI